MNSLVQQRGKDMTRPAEETIPSLDYSSVPPIPVVSSPVWNCSSIESENGDVDGEGGKEDLHAQYCADVDSPDEYQHEDGSPTVGRDEALRESEDRNEIGECDTDVEEHDGMLLVCEDDDYDSDDERYNRSRQSRNGGEHHHGKGVIHEEHRECSSYVTHTIASSELKSQRTPCQTIEKEVHAVDRVWQKNSNLSQNSSNLQLDPDEASLIPLKDENQRFPRYMSTKRRFRHIHNSTRTEQDLLSTSAVDHIVRPWYVGSSSLEDKLLGGLDWMLLV